MANVPSSAGTAFPPSIAAALQRVEKRLAALPNLPTFAELGYPAYRKVVADQGAEVGGGTPAMFSSFVEAESQRWMKLIYDKGIKADWASTAAATAAARGLLRR